MKILLISSIVWLIAQFNKVLYFYYLNKKINLKLFFSSGGMPSAHSGFITAVTLQVGLIEGFNSTLFAIAASIAFIVIYDSFNVRRSVGIQGQTINLMLEYYKNVTNQEEIKNLKEVMGHTPLQVVFGILLGAIVVIISYAFGLV